MPVKSNDTGRRIVELDDELLSFVLLNCETNLHQMMGYIQMVHDGKATLSRENAEKMVGHIENFKKLKRALEKAR
jgi:hypothetical protein